MYGVHYQTFAILETTLTYNTQQQYAETTLTGFFEFVVTVQPEEAWLVCSLS